MMPTFKLTQFMSVIGLLLSFEHAAALHEIYDGCQVSYGCFGTKYVENEMNCVSAGDCLSLIKFKYDNSTDKVKLNIHHNFTSSETNNYVALGLSMDDDMGDDLVFSCTSTNGAAIKYTYNKGRANLDNLVFDSTAPTTQATSDVNGVKTCEIETVSKLMFKPPQETAQKTFDLKTSKFYLLVATGTISGSSLTKHDKKMHSSQAMDLKMVKMPSGAAIQTANMATLVTTFIVMATMRL